MKKIIRFGVVMFLISVVLLGCQQQDNKLEVKEEIKEINIFKSNEFKKESLDLIVSASDTDNAEIFETVKNIISNATKQEGVVNTIEPNYDLEIIYKDNSTKELYLWLLDAEGGKGSLMEVEDTHVIYNFSEELNTKLIDLIDSVKN